MSSSLVLLRIVLPIGIVLLLALSFLTSFFILRYQHQSQIKKLTSNLHAERLERLAKTLEKAGLTSYNSKQNREQVKLLEIAYDQVEASISQATAAIQHYAKRSYLKARKVRARALVDVQEQIATSFFLERKFEGISQKIISQDEHLRAEFTLSQNLLRQGLDFYAQRRLLLEEARPALDLAETNMRDLAASFNKLLARNDLKAANNTLKQYVKAVSAFIVAVDLGPALQSYIFEIIPRLINDLRAKYQAHQQSLPVVYANNDLVATLQLIAPQFKLLRKHFLALDFEVSTDLIRKILRTIKALERQSDFEAYVENLFQTSLASVTLQVETTLIRYQEVREQFVSLTGRARVVSIEINEAYQELVRLGTSLQHLVADFKLWSSPTSLLLPSAKVTRLRRLVQLTHQVLVEINALNSAFWALNVETAQERRKYQRAEAALNEVMANVRRQSLVLSPEDQARFESISEQLNLVAPQLKKDQISSDVKASINALTLKTAAFYQNASASLQIAAMTSNALREFAPLRALEPKLHLAFLQAERLYLEGKYAEALNLVVARLEERLH